MSKLNAFLLISFLLLTSCFNNGSEIKMTAEQLKSRENKFLKKIGMKVDMPTERITHSFKSEYGIYYDCEIDGDLITYSPTMSRKNRRIKSIRVLYVTPDYYPKQFKKSLTLKDAIKKHGPNSPELSQFAWIRNRAGRIYGIADVSSSITFSLVDSNSLTSDVQAVNYLERSCPVFTKMKKSDYIAATEIKALLK